MKIKLNKSFGSNSHVGELDVKQIKKVLNRLDYYKPFEKVGITGVPDRAVFNALRKFQKDPGLQPTGKAQPNDETINALSREASKKKDGKYIWRTVGDDKVRGSHAKLNNTVRYLSDSPAPGEEFNCRCWGVPVSKASCDEEKNDLVEAQKKVKDLSERLNGLLLQLNELREENNKLIKNAQISLGARLVAHLLTLPFDRIGVLGELLRRYFESIISDELINSAENFMRKRWSVKQKFEYKSGQFILVRAQLEQAAKELEKAKEKLKECEENGKKS